MAMLVTKKEQVLIVNAGNVSGRRIYVHRVCWSRRAAMNYINKNSNINGHTLFALVKDDKNEVGDRVMMYPGDQTFGDGVRYAGFVIDGMSQVEIGEGWSDWENI